MTELADWCAFFGAWLLFAGPVYQAETELDAELREAESMIAKARAMPVPGPISKWWWLLPPVAWLKHRAQTRAARALARETLSDEETAQFMRFSEKATGWMLVAGGAGLIGVAETVNLDHAYEWPGFVTWLIIAFMIVISFQFTALRARIRAEVLGIEKRLRGDRSARRSGRDKSS